MNYRHSLLAPAVSAGFSIAPAALAIGLGGLNFRTNLIDNVTKALEAGMEWRKYNLAFGPLLPEGQQVEFMAKYKF